MYKFVIGVCLIIATLVLVITADNYSKSLLTAEEKAAYQASVVAEKAQKQAEETQRDNLIKARELRLKSTPYSDVADHERAEWLLVNSLPYAMWLAFFCVFIAVARGIYGIVLDK